MNVVLDILRETISTICCYIVALRKQAGADITGQLQVRPMLYTLYISINLRVVKMLHTDNKQQITKLIQSPSKRRSYVTPGADIQKQHIPLNN